MNINFGLYWRYNAFMKIIGRYMLYRNFIYLPVCCPKNEEYLMMRSTFFLCICTNILTT